MQWLESNLGSMLHVLCDHSTCPYEDTVLHNRPKGVKAVGIGATLKVRQRASELALACPVCRKTDLL